MAENKTRPTDASVEDYIASRASQQQLTDCRELMLLFETVTRHTPRMWGPSIVGSVAEVRRRHGQDDGV